MWGDELSIAAAAEAFQKNMFVFRVDEPVPRLFTPRQKAAADNIFIEFNAVREHYDPLVPREPAPESQSQTEKPAMKKSRKKKMKRNQKTTKKRRRHLQKPIAKQLAVDDGPRKRVASDTEAQQSSPPSKTRAIEVFNPIQLEAPATVGVDILQLMPTCNKCGFRCKTGKLSGKSRTAFTCTFCNTKITYMRKTFGSWPPANFDSMTPETKIQFYQEAKSISGPNLKLFTEEFIKINKTHEVGSEDSGSYMPLGWYERQGFDTHLIQQRCTDFKEHPILGRVYKVSIQRDWNNNVESRDRGQSVSAETPKVPVVVNTGGNKAGKTSITAESREALRVAKTEAVQAARDLAKHKAAAQKHIKTVMKAQFNLKKVATPKNIKLCSMAEKTSILAIKKDIVACEKACSSVIKGKSPEDMRL